MSLSKQQGWRRFILKEQEGVSWTSGAGDIQTVLHLIGPFVCGCLNSCNLASILFEKEC